MGGRKEVCVYHKLTKYAPSFAHYFEAQVVFAAIVLTKAAMTWLNFMSYVM